MEDTETRGGSSSQTHRERSITLTVPDEDHTLGTVLNSALWSNPHVMVAQYAQKHPVNREEITIHCQTDSGCTAVSSLEDAVYTTRGMLHALDNELDRALSEFMNE